MANNSYGTFWMRDNKTCELTILSLLLVCAVFGNMLALIVVHKSRRIQWSTNILVAHLAIANLVCAGMSTSIYIYWNVSRRPAFCVMTCKILYFSNFLNSGISVILLAFMALDRYYVIVYPLAVHMTREYTMKILTIVWFLTIASSCPLFYFVQEVDNFFGMFCMQNIDCLSWKTYLCLYFLTFIIAPLLLISVLNVKIFWTIRERSMNTGSVCSNKIRPSTEHLKQLGRGAVPSTKQKTAKMLLVLNIYFALSWLPYFIFLLFVLQHDFTYTAYTVVVFMALSNAGMNPIIYWVSNGNFRRGAKNMFMFQLRTQYATSAFSHKVHPKLSIDLAYADVRNVNRDHSMFVATVDSKV